MTHFEPSEGKCMKKTPNNERTKGNDGNTQEYQIQILYILQGKKPGTPRNYALKQMT